MRSYARRIRFTAAWLTAAVIAACSDSVNGPTPDPDPTDRDVLYVDDLGGDRTGHVPDDCAPLPPTELGNPAISWPQDQCHDQIVREAIGEALAMLGHSDWIVDRYEPLDPKTGLPVEGEAVVDSTSFDYWVIEGPVTLSQLSRYRLVVWNLNCSETAMTSLHQQETEDALASYLRAGGEVCITGPGAFSCTLRDGQGVGLSPFGFEPGDFVHDFLKITSTFEAGECLSGCFRNAGRNIALQRMNGFEGARVSPLAKAEGYPDLRVARPPFTSPTRGVASCEGMVVEHGLDVNAKLEFDGGRLDTLYFYQSNGQLQVVPPLPSYMDDAVCGLRYAGPQQGKLMMLGFPLYYLPVDEMEGLMVASLRWLLQ